MSEERRLTRGERCHKAMRRLMQVLTEEFDDFGPPEVVFLLNWLQHRYINEVEAIVREGPPQQPADACTH